MELKNENDNDVVTDLGGINKAGELIDLFTWLYISPKHRGLARAADGRRSYHVHAPTIADARVVGWNLNRVAGCSKVTRPINSHQNHFFKKKIH